LKFIDDFYSFYNEGQNEYDFAIDLEDIAFWLEVKKGHLKTLLENNFVKNRITLKPSLRKNYLEQEQIILKL